MEAFEPLSILRGKAELGPQGDLKDGAEIEKKVETRV